MVCFLAIYALLPCLQQLSQCRLFKVFMELGYLRIASLLRSSRNATFIRNPLIFFENGYLLMEVRGMNCTPRSCKQALGAVMPL